jgi:hypothetical protein
MRNPAVLASIRELGTIISERSVIDLRLCEAACALGELLKGKPVLDEEERLEAFMLVKAHQRLESQAAGLKDMILAAAPVFALKV